MSASTQDRVIEIVSNVIGVPVSKLDLNSSPESIPEWESMKHINLVLALEEEFEVQFDDTQIASLQNVSSIVSILEKS